MKFYSEMEKAGIREKLLCVLLITVGISWHKFKQILNPAVESRTEACQNSGIQAGDAAGCIYERRLSSGG